MGSDLPHLSRKNRLSRRWHSLIRLRRALLQDKVEDQPASRLRFLQ
jgi:hypothetical protein